LFYPQHLPHAVTLARALPELPMVIDHLAKPPIRSHQIRQWRESLRAAARFPNLFCKLSGMITEADWQRWQAEDLQPYVDAALEAFGPNRCMFGSDWPVCELAGSYAQVVSALETCLGCLTPDEQNAIWSETARRFYHLERG
jgi:L-fuconolactonase